MSLISDLLNQSNKKFKIEKTKVPNDSNVYIIKHQKKVIAIGVEVKDSNNSSSKFAKEKIEYLKNHLDFIFKLSNLPMLYKKAERKWDFEMFFISDEYIIHAPWSWGEWVIYDPETSLELLFNRLTSLPELRTVSEKKDDKLQILQSETSNQNIKLQEKINEIQELQSKLDFYKEEYRRFEDEIKSLKRSENILEIKNREFSAQVEYLNIIAKGSIIQRLTKKQIDFLLSRIRVEIRIDLDLSFPNMIVEFETSTSVEWDTSGDWRSIPITVFTIVDIEGIPKSISKKEISEFPNFSGFGGTSYDFNYIFGSVLFEKKDLLIELKKRSN